MKKSVSLLPINPDLLNNAITYLKEVKVYFQHVKRNLNIIADCLSKQPFNTLLQERLIAKKTSEIPRNQNPLTKPTHPDSFTTENNPPPDKLAEQISAMVVDSRFPGSENPFALSEFLDSQQEAIANNLFFQICTQNQSYYPEEVAVFINSQEVDDPEVYIEDLDTNNEGDNFSLVNESPTSLF